MARRAFGDDGPGRDTDFEAMAQLAHAAAGRGAAPNRQQGLSLTSSLAESLVGEFTARVKSRQK